MKTPGRFEFIVPLRAGSQPPRLHSDLTAQGELPRRGRREPLGVYAKSIKALRNKVSFAWVPSRASGATESRKAADATRSAAKPPLSVFTSARFTVVTLCTAALPVPPLQRALERSLLYAASKNMRPCWLSFGMAAAFIPARPGAPAGS